MYTEQSLWRLYAKYQAECFDHYLPEDTKYAGEIPAEVTVHEANCWHALWKASQDGFDMMTELADRLREAQQAALKMGGAKLLDRSTKKLRSGDRFDPKQWEIVPRTWATA